MSRKPPDQMSPFEWRLDPRAQRSESFRVERAPRGAERPETETITLTTVSGTVTAEIKDQEVLEALVSKPGRGGSSYQEWVREQMQNFVLFGSPLGPGDTARSERPAERKERELRPLVEKYFLKAEHQLGWGDIIGNEAARQALLVAIEHPVTHGKLYAHYRKRAAKGVLLYGPPGCGKTMFGKAAAAALARLHRKDATTLIKINGTEIQQPYVGQTEQIIRNIFAYARAFKELHGFPLVIFIDEADAILPNRDGSVLARRAHSFEESNVATFLTEMDGLEDSGAFVILATNRPHAIDAALTRDGRCDRRIKIERPTQEACETIAARAIAGVPLAPGVDAGALTAFAIENLYDPDRKLRRLRTSRGLDFLRLSDVVNGAMVVGLFERAKEFAFTRDLANGGTPSGICEQDLLASIEVLLRENLDVDHSYALAEYCERTGFEVTAVEPLMRGGGAAE